MDLLAFVKHLIRIWGESSQNAVLGVVLSSINLDCLFCSLQLETILLTCKMPYSEEDKWIIKHCHYRETYKWGSRKILTQLGADKDWSRSGVQKIIDKVDSTGSIARRSGSGRPRSVRIPENFNEVEDRIFSKENEEREWEKHESPRVIARKIDSTEIWRKSYFHRSRARPVKYSI